MYKSFIFIELYILLHDYKSILNKTFALSSIYLRCVSQTGIVNIDQRMENKLMTDNNFKFSKGNKTILCAPQKAQCCW